MALMAAVAAAVAVSETCGRRWVSGGPHGQPDGYWTATPRVAVQARLGKPTCNPGLTLGREAAVAAAAAALAQRGCGR